MANRFKKMIQPLLDEARREGYKAGHEQGMKDGFHIGRRGSMKIYKNPFVSRESYFVKTGKARTGKCEASASKGYSIDFIDGKWEVCETAYYDFSLEKELPVIAENNVSIKSVIERAILNAVLDLVGSAKMDGDGNG